MKKSPMNKSIVKSSIVAASLLMGACAGNQNSGQEAAAWAGAAVGVLAGGALGSWAGAQVGGSTVETLFMLSGAASGGMYGYEMGRSLVVADRPAYNNAITNAFDNTNGNATWQNAETGTGGYIKAGQTFSNANGALCRQFRATVAFTDEVLNGPGAACQFGDNDEWTLVADAFN